MSTVAITFSRDRSTRSPPVDHTYRQIFSFCPAFTFLVEFGRPCDDENEKAFVYLIYLIAPKRFNPKLLITIKSHSILLKNTCGSKNASRGCIKFPIQILQPREHSLETTDQLDFYTSHRFIFCILFNFKISCSNLLQEKKAVFMQSKIGNLLRD